MMHESRGYCAEIGQADWDSQIQSALNFTRLKNVKNHCQVDATSCKWGAMVDMPQDMSSQPGRIS
jgi:hypothetical protein